MRVPLLHPLSGSAGCAGIVAVHVGGLEMSKYIQSCVQEGTGCLATLDAVALGADGLSLRSLTSLLIASDIVAVEKGESTVWTALAPAELVEFGAFGVCGVSKAVVTQRSTWIEELGRMQVCHNVETLGIDLSTLATVDSIDENHATCTSVREVYEKFGIEAAMASLYRDFIEVLGDGVHARHVQIMIDSMCFEGFPNAINRHGLAKTQATPLHRASFEETVETLMSAALYSAKFGVNGITEQIMMGTQPTVGSGTVVCVTNELRFVGRPIDGDCEPDPPDGGTPPGSPTRTPPGSPLRTPPGSPPAANGADSPAFHPEPAADSPPFHPSEFDSAGEKRFPLDFWQYVPMSPRPIKRFRVRSPTPD